MADQETARFVMSINRKAEAAKIMKQVMAALEEKGYNPKNQLVGYFISGDPTYITNHQGARAIIRKMERDELLEVILAEYLEQLGN
ncbi:MAG: IreB family regulatory phosphoprotein [Clostridiaceae bacterium]|nr:IreB family regulatory phosphoprotein [Bacillota bacterium]NLN51811.1 IreB family regulatory phosphoprotein [Clostridiaceae bacterium]